MRFLSKIRLYALVACLALAASGAVVPAAAARQAAPPRSPWHATEVYPVVHSLTNQAVGVTPAFHGLSCLSPGNCQAAGWYARTRRNPFGEDRPMVATESNGAWGVSQRLWLPATRADPDAGAQVTSLSCPTADWCAAGGLVPSLNSTARYAFVITKSGGRWNRPHRVQLPPDPQASPAISEIDGISCARPGWCVAVGWYITRAVNYTPIAVTESGGHWQRAVALPPGLRSPNFANLSSVSCPTPRWCLAVGGDTYGPHPNPPSTDLVTVFSDGRWQQPAPTQRGFPGSLVSVSCSAPGQCMAVGGGSGELLSHGRWQGLNIPLPPDGEPIDSYGPDITSVSCTPSACLAGGRYFSETRGIFPAFVVSYSAGKWRDPVEVRLPRNASPGGSSAPPQSQSLTAVSCVRSSCEAVGTYETRTGLFPDWAAAGPG